MIYMGILYVVPLLFYNNGELNVNLYNKIICIKKRVQNLHYVKEQRFASNIMPHLLQKNLVA